ncbi:MAG: DUF2087 domain-containing protein [Acidimicrobiales bacterium]
MLDPAALVGLLADPDRRRVVAALVLDASSAAEIVAATGLDGPRVVKALTRLERSGLVEADGPNRYLLLGEAFATAARAAARDRPAAVVPDGPPGTAAVRRAFVRDGRLLSIPTVRHKRLVVLDLLAQEFEPGRRYRETAVNLILGRWHADTAALRRYLVDEGFLDRADGEYWRAGGTVEA